MNRPALEVADVVRQYGAAYLTRYGSTLSPEQHHALRAIAVCRTAALGGHATQCDQCGHLEITYNSCGNRHCPKCPGRAQAAWLAAREAELLDVPYVHVVFTLPQPLSPLTLQNPRVLYNLLFQAVAETLLTVARDPRHLGAEIGFLAVLHTWGQTLHHHPVWSKNSNVLFLQRLLVFPLRRENRPTACRHAGQRPHGSVHHH